MSIESGSKTRRVVVRVVCTLVAIGLITALPASIAEADPFYSRSTAEIGHSQPGDVLATRQLSYHLSGISTPVSVVQLVYRTIDAQGRPSANVTSILRPPGKPRRGQAIAYNSFYDSLNPADSPSRSIAGDVTFGGLINTVETSFITPLLLQGYPVIVTDTQGQRADFAAGPEYGTNTLDAIRAAGRAAHTGLTSRTKVALMGYSGGSIATNWAATLAPKYAPDVNTRLVGAAGGGLLVAPFNNLRYVSGSLGWSGVAVMAIIGAIRAYDADLTPYLSARGRALTRQLSHASIADVLYRHPLLAWRDIVKPQYADPASVKPFVEIANKLNLGQAPTPTMPLLLVQSTRGELEGTAGNLPGVGVGDGVMIAGDVRSLARQYCADGNRSVRYEQVEYASHQTAALVWAAQALPWINDRFAGKPAPTSCGHIPRGNSLQPVRAR
ncbi:putative lipase [Gordonia effusa NBRC 100432]|uniref:Putative lipase n=1 Tax=Gordonia effusa NBRC 100432 TaxID=1077974 RepID=H0QXT7_9ACTN|nr:lipase family protein [Gordonia effusa]GAB17638.1 putative lipase [Gordonia effusa NBRC 100432]